MLELQQYDHLYSAEREPDPLIEERGPAIKGEANLPSPLMLLQAILMDGREEPDIVSTERGEGGRQGGKWEGPVSHWPEAGVKDQYSKLTLTVKITLRRQIHQFKGYLDKRKFQNLCKSLKAGSTDMKLLGH